MLSLPSAEKAVALALFLVNFFRILSFFLTCFYTVGSGHMMVIV